MKLQCLTDKGTTSRENQDNYWSVIAEVDGCETGVVCLCDGMGGLKNGGEASKIVVQSVKDYLSKGFDFDGVLSILNEANNKVFMIGGDSKESMMGTTCSLLMLSNGSYRVYHVGDSRVYLLRSGVPYRLTEDHSAVVALNIDKEKEPKKWLKYRSKLTRCIGARSTVKIECYEGIYLPGDTFVVCSDGVWHLFDDIKLSDGLIEDLQGLLHRCMENGEKDNLTICVLRI
jgi:protein phosphatase